MKDWGLYICHIHDAMKRILDHAPKSIEEVRTDSWNFDAILRNFQVIGEATKRLPDTIKEQPPDIPWKEMAGLRDYVVHEYDDYDLPVLWEVLQTSLPRDYPKIKAMYDSLPHDHQ